ncbi:hypothetical protein OS188_07440 [Xanthomarina sp. F1114]|uniref:hypothetical protein n=1 Tax=Xanthomarina sp. F1114 TaxID=2996019 RepID=UPI00225DF295|nr:hypothetical protein [Xanthomarina sp. F1114]MCX7547781.1 hypothetical protein [Xanthomarina sp. F1114]
MSSIHYFQRYSQRENVATNNTLLLLSRLYQHSTYKFHAFLTDLTEDSIDDTSISFNQQEKNKDSIPDGSIYQPSFKVEIETKLHKGFNSKQLINHLNSFNDEDYKVLLSLSPEIPSNLIKEKVIEAIITSGINVRFVSTTFETLISKFRKVLQDYDFELNEIIDDFESYCWSSGLISTSKSRMRAVTCGWTLEENFNYDLYYAKKEKGFSEHSYIGIYANKSIRGIGKISNIVLADMDSSGELIIKEKTKPLSETEINNIKNVIPAALKNNGWDLSKNHRFFCVEKFYETDFKKETNYPLQGTKFFNLKTVLSLKKLPDVPTIAELLKSKTW